MEGMAKVVLEKRLVEVPIAMGPSRLEVLSGLHVGYFWQVHHLDIALASGTLHWCRRGCFIVGVWRKRGRTGTRLVESTQPFSLPVSLSSFGCGEWHLSGFFMERATKSCLFLRFLFVLSPHVAGHFETLSDFILHSPTQFAQTWQFQYFIPLSILFERFCVDWNPDQRDGTTGLRAMAALSWLSSRFRH